MTIPAHLSDDDLLAEVARLAAAERSTTAVLIAHLAELHGRRLHERAGYASLFSYCTGELRMSEAAAYDRMRAAKVARRFPIVLELLAAGRLTLTAVRLLAPRLTRENHAALFAAAADRNKRQVLELLAREFPQPDVLSSVRKLPAARVQGPSDSARTASVATARDHGASTQHHATASDRVTGRPSAAGARDPARPVAAAAPELPPPLVPLSADRYRVTFTATTETRNHLDLARDLLRHQVPDGDVGRIMALALEVLVKDLLRRKCALTDRPRGGATNETGHSRYVRAEVRRTVFLRDGGRCAYRSPSGQRCGERGFVEFHHVRPYAAGGSAAADNIQLRCRAHNGYEVDVFFGRGKRHVGKEAAAD